MFLYYLGRELPRVLYQAVHLMIWQARNQMYESSSPSSLEMDKLQLDNNEIIDEHISYHEKMIIYLKKLKSGEEAEKPKKPSSKFPDLNPSSRKFQHLEGPDLNNYLQRLIVNGSSEPVVSRQNRSFEELKQNLKILHNNVMVANSKTLLASLAFGKALNIAFEQFQLEKRKKKMQPWKLWLETNIPIKQPYAHKLRTVAKIVHNFPLFKRLSITFTEVYQRRDSIRKMLQIEDIAEQWRQS